MSSSTTTRWGRRVPVGDYRTKETVDVRLARRLGCQESTAHQKLWGRNNLRTQLVAVIMAFADEPDRFAHWWASIGLALYAVRGDLSNNSIDIMAQRDSSEDATRTRALMTNDWSQEEKALELEIEAKQRVLAGIRKSRGKTIGHGMESLANRSMEQ